MDVVRDQLGRVYGGRYVLVAAPAGFVGARAAVAREGGHSYGEEYTPETC